MSDTGPTPAAAAAPEVSPPVAPGLGELFERSLTGLLLGRCAFAPLAERPAPSFGVMTALALSFVVIGVGLNAALAAVSQPALLGRYPAWFYAAVSAAALGISLAWLLLSSALLYALGKALGGDGGFERGYQASAMLFALAPVQALASMFPLAWAAPSVLFAWAGAGALSGLLRANFSGALAACALLGGLSIAGQAAARAAYAKSQEVVARTAALMQAGQAAGQAAAMMQALQQGQALPPEGAAARADAADGAPVAAGLSSLDLLRGPGDEGAPPPEAAPAGKVLLQQGDALRVNAEGMIESLLPMLSNPAITNNLDAQGKADMKELQDIMTKLKTQSAAGTINARDHAATMQKIQTIAMRLMLSNMRAPAPPTAQPARRPQSGSERTR